MLVSVRGNIYQSSDPYIDWETLGDFLVSYLKSSFGDFWPENELIVEIRA
ncbi:MAG: Gpi18-like mannosyltransferase [Psychromonas sp.]|jgi:Gpi18-like mannosyltransferase